MSATTPAAVPPRRKSRRTLRVLFVGVLLLVTLALAAPAVVARTGLRDRLINRVVQSPNLTPSTAEASFGWTSPLSVRGMELASETGSVRIRVDEVAADRPWWQLAAALPDLGTVTLEKPHIEVALPLEQFEPEPKRPIPTFTGVVRNGGLTVRVPGLADPVIDVEGVGLTCRVEDAGGGRVLVVDPAKLFQNQKVTPKLCDRLLHLVAPTLGDAPEVSGEFSLALDKFRVPLGTPKDQLARRVEMEGTLTLHHVTTRAAGPLVQSIVKVVADKYGRQPPETVRAVKNAEVRFRVADGRLHHEGLKIGFPDISPDLLVTSRGSVGIDESLDLHLEIPRFDQAAQKADGPTLCHVTGTVRSPKVSVTDASLRVRLPGRDTPFVVVDNIDLKLHVERGPAGPVLAVDPFRVYDRRKLSAQTTDQLLRLVDPTLPDLTDVSGEVSLAVSKARIPLNLTPERVAAGTEVEGTFTLHKVSTDVPHPVRKVLARLLADLHGKEPPRGMRLVKDAEVRFRVADGRLHHEGLKFGFPDVNPALQMTSRGSVGLDGSLDLTFDLPRLDADKRKEKGPVSCRITGTIDDPKVAVTDASLVVRLPGHKTPLLAIDGVDLTMHVAGTKAGPVLVVDPVRVFERQTFRPDLVGDLVHLLVPGIRDVPGVGGEMSLTLDKMSVPLDAPGPESVKNVTIEGRLALHRISTDVSGPVRHLMVRALADVYGKKPSDVARVVKDAEVRFRVADGRLHYDGMRVGFPDISPDLMVAASGSVGLDETLDMRLAVPRLDKAKQQEKGPLPCRITGTVKNPVLTIEDAPLVVRLDDRPRPLLDAGTVNLSFHVEDSKNGPLLCLAPTTVFEKKKFGPELASEFMSLVLPTLGDVAKVRGEVSLSIDRFRVPVGLAGPDFLKKTELAGKVQLHQVVATVETPLLKTMVKVLADLHGKAPSDVVRVTKNAEVRFEVRDGRLYHEGLKLGFPDISPDLVGTSRGTVGLDKSLDLTLEIPRVLANGMIDPAAEKLGPVRFQVTGTFDRPVVTEIKGAPKQEGANMTARPLLGLATVALGAGLAAPEPLRAQAPPAASEVQAVARVSKGLIEEVTHREVAASLPYHAKILGLYFAGDAHGMAKPAVEILPSEHDATFVVSASGTGHSWARGVRGPFVATGPLTLPFATTTRVGFDGRNFTRIGTATHVEVDFDLQKIEGRRGRLPGRVIGRLAMPVAQRLVPRGERQAELAGEPQLRDFVDGVSDTVVGVLNRTAPIEASFHRVYPKTTDWVFRVSTTPGYIRAAYGPPGAAAPTLPANPARVAGDVWVELWLRSTSEEARLLRDLSRTPLARALLRKYLEATVPELAAVAADWSVAAADSWVVVSIRPEVPKTIAIDPARAPFPVRIGEPAR